MKLALADTVWGPHLVPVNDVNVGLALMLYGEYSASQAAACHRLLQPGDTAIDIGANIGALALPLLRAVGPTGKVVCFEPQPSLAKLLRATLALNADNPSSVEVHQCGLGRLPDAMHIPPVDYDAEANNFGCVALAATGTDPVAVKPLDWFHWDRVRLIKIDVEGMESEVIAGAAGTIAFHKPVLLVENDREEKYLPLIAQIEALGYECYWFLTPLFNPKNARGEKRDIYTPGCGSLDMLCFPKGGALPDFLPELPRATKEFAEEWLRFAK